MRSPKSLTITESTPGSIDRYSVYVTEAGNAANILASRDYPVAGNETTCPIGSDDFFAPVSDGVSIDIYLIERAGPGASSDDSAPQLFPGGPFTVKTLPNGAESLSVQL